MTANPSRQLLFGLLALQNGLIDQTQLVAAFAAWSRVKARALADHFIERGDLDADQSSLLEAMVGMQVKKHGGDTEKSLASIPAGRSTRERLAALGDPELTQTVTHLGSDSTERYSGGTTSSAVGTATSAGERFRILRPHARGGLGAVFVALDGELHREVALKQILDHYADDPDSRQRFLIEAEITGGLEHPGIVPVYGLGTNDGGRPYYAMRFIKGDSLKEAIAQFHADETLKDYPGRRSLELRKLLGRFTDVCNAIEYAHSRGVLHRDIKPSNIIVGKYGETLVVDWGLAKPMGQVEPGTDTGERTLAPRPASGSAETLPGTALGTPAYMSPEQSRGELDRLGPRSDVYSLGATLYCLLTGKPPFESDDIGEVLRKVQRGEFAPPRQVDSSIDRALEAICLKAMALDPDDRFVSARSLADDIDRWLAEEPVLAWREPLVRRARRWGRRNRTVMVAAVSTLLMALVGTGSVLGVQTAANRDLRTAHTKLMSANALTTKANNELVAANNRESERFDLAMDAIKTFHSGVSDDVLLKTKEFRELRTKLLLEAKNFYGRLESLLANQSDRRSRRSLGRAYGELASLTEDIGSQAEALAATERVLAIRQALAADALADSSDLAAMAATLTRIARLQFRTGKSAVALATMKEEKAVRERLVKESPEDWVALKDLAHNLNNIGIVQHNMGQLADARVSYERALKIREQLCAARPNDLDLRQGMARTLNSIGAYYHDSGRNFEAIDSTRRALEIREAIAAAKPNDVASQMDLGMTCNNLGALQFELGRTAKAREAYIRARGIYEKAIEANPNVSTYSEMLGDTCRNLASTLIKLGRPDEASEALDRSFDASGMLARDNPTVPRFQIGLTRVAYLRGKQLRIAGHREEAIAALEAGLSRLESVLKANPELFEAKVELEEFSSALANLFRDTGRTALAREFYDRSRETIEGLIKTRPGSVSDQFELGRILIEINKVEPDRGAWNRVIGTLRTGIELSEKRPAGPSSLYERAQGHALLASVYARTDSGRTPEEARGEADLAMTWLRQAVEAGYRDVEAMRNDDDLKPLEPRSDFQMLLLDLGFPGEPFAGQIGAERPGR